MHPVYIRPQSARQQKSVTPMPSHDGPQPDDLRVRRVLSRVSMSGELARELAGLAFAVSEKMERRI